MDLLLKAPHLFTMVMGFLRAYHGLIQFVPMGLILMTMKILVKTISSVYFGPLKALYFRNTNRMGSLSKDGLKALEIQYPN